jgi:hypothetical protein
MNESEFENELRALRPLPPSVTSIQAVARQLAQGEDDAILAVRPAANPRERHSLLWGLCWALGGAAAAVAVLLSLESAHGAGALRLQAPAPTPSASPRGFHPTESSRELVSAEVGGLVYGDDLAPNRVLRYSSVERRAWADPATGARVEMEVPREDLLLVPVSFQ